MPKKLKPGSVDGRPSSYSETIADAVCDCIAEGEPLRVVCERVGFPGMTTIFRWAHDNEDFRKKYARAKQLQAERMAEELIEIADDGRNDWMERELKNGETIEVPNQEVLQRSRLRVDTRKWLMSKMLPKKYGEKVELSGSGEGGAFIFQTSNTDAKL